MFYPLSPKGSPFDAKNRLALDRVKSISHSYNVGCKGLREIVFFNPLSPNGPPFDE